MHITLVSSLPPTITTSIPSTPSNQIPTHVGSQLHFLPNTTTTGSQGKDYCTHHQLFTFHLSIKHKHAPEQHVLTLHLVNIQAGSVRNLSHGDPQLV